MMLANILNGSIPPARRKNNHERKPTLIIAPSSVASQWYSEMEKHCEKKWLGLIVDLYSKNSLKSNGKADHLSQADIV